MRSSSTKKLSGYACPWTSYNPHDTQQTKNPHYYDNRSSSVANTPPFHTNPPSTTPFYTNPFPSNPVPTAPPLPPYQSSSSSGYTASDVLMLAMRLQCNFQWQPQNGQLVYLKKSKECVIVFSTNINLVYIVHNQNPISLQVSASDINDLDTLLTQYFQE